MDEATSLKAGRRSGSHGGGSAGATPLKMRPQSGLQSGGRSGATSSGSVPHSGLHGDGSSASATSMMTVPRSGFAAGDPAVINAAAEVGRDEDPGSSLKRRENPWNEFQHSQKGKGLSSTVLSRLYRSHKDERF